MSPNLMWQMSPCDRICMKLMCPRNDLGSAAFLFRDIVVRCVGKSILSACLGGSRLAAAIRQVAKAGYLGGPAALRGGSELRGIGRYHGGDAVGPAILTWRPCFDDAFTADLWTPPWGAHLLCLNFVRSACLLGTPDPCGVHTPLRCGAWGSSAKAGRQDSLCVGASVAGEGQLAKSGRRLAAGQLFSAPARPTKPGNPPIPFSACAGGSSAMGLGSFRACVEP